MRCYDEIFGECHLLGGQETYFFQIWLLFSGVLGSGFLASFDLWWMALRQMLQKCVLTQMVWQMMSLKSFDLFKTKNGEKERKELQ